MPALIFKAQSFRCENEDKFSSNIPDWTDQRDRYIGQSLINTGNTGKAKTNNSTL
ncbi:MAG: hypothetical protein ACHBN1_22655 [Heteroscytonema crispum UTEX LB 1556]